MAKRKAVNVVELVGKWLGEYLPEIRMASGNTIDSYEEALQLYHKYLKETGGAGADPSLKKKGIFAARISHFDSVNVMGFVDWLRSVRGNSSRTIEQRLSAIKSFLEYAALKDLAFSSLYVQVQRIKVGKRDPGRLVGHMNEEAWGAVVSQPALPKLTEHRNWVFMILMYEIAGRNSEIIRLRPCDLVLDGDNPRVYVWGKGNKEGVTPIRESVAQILREYLKRFHSGREKSDDPLFYVRRNGEKCFMSTDCSEAFLKRYGELARKLCASVPERVHPHLIRHTRAMHLKENGMTDEELAVFLRHSGLHTVKVYAQASASSKRKILERINGKDDGSFPKRGFWEDDEEMIHRLRNPTKR